LGENEKRDALVGESGGDLGFRLGENEIDE